MNPETSNGTSQIYIFELLCIEPIENDIQSENALLKGLAFSSRLWNGLEPKEISTKAAHALTESKMQISLILKSLDTSKMLTDYSEGAYILHVEGKILEELEPFRLRLIRHLRNNLKFNHIRILTDDISMHIANRLYPEINRVESLLRRYLTKFFTQRVGLSWWETTATRNMVDKVRMRFERKDDMTELVDEDVSLVDFDDLGELIYKQSSGFNHPEKIVNKLLTIKTLEDLKSIQTELQGNYTKYFKEFFQDKHFEQRWRELYKIRNKVAHQGTFYLHELERGLQLTAALSDIISIAEGKIDEIVFSVEEKEAIRKATIEAATEAVEVAVEQEVLPDNYFRGGLPGLKIIGKIDVPEKELYITEEQLVYELEEAEEAKYNNYVGLKWFVTIFLHNKNYVISASYSLVNILIDKGKIELYEVRTYDGFVIRAIRLAEELD